MDEMNVKDLIEIADNIFDNEIWQNSKERMKEMSKREYSRHMFILGFVTQYKYMMYKIKDFEKDFKNMTPEDIQKLVNGDDELKDKDLITTDEEIKLTDAGKIARL